MSPNLENGLPGGYDHWHVLAMRKLTETVFVGVGDNDDLPLADAGGGSGRGAAIVSDDVQRVAKECFRLGARYDGGRKSRRICPNSK